MKLKEAMAASSSANYPQLHHYTELKKDLYCDILFNKLTSVKSVPPNTDSFKNSLRLIKGFTKFLKLKIGLIDRYWYWDKVFELSK